MLPLPAWQGKWRGFPGNGRRILPQSVAGPRQVDARIPAVLHRPWLGVDRDGQHPDLGDLRAPVMAARLTTAGGRRPLLRRTGPGMSSVSAGLLSGPLPGGGQRRLDVAVDRHDLVQADELNYAGGG
jgi:hypothetical protein